ncbi:peroxisomal membrane anchor protein conserved region-domain-containing protein [Tuber brumale]|nr:peroxisomal membrane anchor protein conserved region-domain-containing protein [Tuber brumale]
MPTETPDPPASATTTTADIPTDLKTIHESSPNPSKQLLLPEARTREELREQAAKFLETGSIKNAPWEQKKEFLLEKGLTGDEIEALVEETERVQKEKMEEAVVTKEEVRVVLERGKGKKREQPSAAVTKPNADDETNSPPNDSDQKNKKTTATTPTASPPLITYPEFLTPAPPPPPQPLVSTSNILKSAYFASAVGSTIYGAHKFIFTPMYSALTDARLDLSSTALNNLTELNTRIRELVPSTRVQYPTTNSNKKNYYPSSPHSSSSSDEDDSSSTSDPSELFHVDAMTQTSPLPDYNLNTSDEAEDLTPDGKLEHLSTQLHALVESHSDGMDNELTFALEDLRSYLESLTYDWGSSSIFTSPYEYAGAKGKDDAVAKVKAEIRSVKGVLLNTKNFPASR